MPRKIQSTLAKRNYKSPEGETPQAFNRRVGVKGMRYTEGRAACEGEGFVYGRSKGGGGHCRRMPGKYGKTNPDKITTGIVKKHGTVYESAKGARYVWVTSKTGKRYKKYLKRQNSATY